jgi:hypothetical protein
VPEPAASDVLAAMLSAFQPLVPAQVAGLPKPSLAMARAEMRNAGIGNYVGSTGHGSIVATDQQAVRVRATMRFTLWGFVAFDVDDAVTALTSNILTKRSDLAAQGFLKLSFDGSSPPEETKQPIAWRRFADYDVLYEFPYEDVGGASGLIHPIQSQEAATGAGWNVLGDLGRWDDQETPVFSIRGQSIITELAALTFFADPLHPPTGSVTITRTFDGAPAPADAGTLVQFLANITNASAPARNQFVSFASPSALLAQFVSDGAPIAMGDRNNDGIPESYVPTHVVFPAPLVMTSVTDRFELSYSQAKFDQTGVLYLRVVRQGG